MSADGFAAIAPALAAHGIALDDLARERLERYAALLLYWNRRINLISRGDAGVLWSRHLLDCLMLERVPPPRSAPRWVDVGAGAGLPAVPLAVLNPEREVSAVERVARKATFLREVARELALDNLIVRQEDAAALPAEPGFAPYDVLVARALAPLPALLALAMPLLRPGGELWAMKGRRWEAEQAAVPEAVRAGYEADASVHAYRLSPGGAGVVLVYRRRGGPSPA